MRSTSTIVYTMLLGLCLSIGASGQRLADRTKQGHWLIQGNAMGAFQTKSGDLYENADGDTPSWFGIDVTGGTFLIDNLAGGLTLGFDSESHGDESQSHLSIGPRIVYFFPLASPVLPFVGAGFIYYTSTREYTSGTIKQELKASGNEIHLTGGVAIPLTNTVGITGSLNYILESYKPDGADKSTSGNVLNIGIGFLVFI